MNTLYQVQRDHPPVTAGFEIYPNTGKIVNAAPILRRLILGAKLEEVKPLLKRLGYNRLTRLTGTPETWQL